MIDLRYELAVERLRGIAGENIVEPSFIPYFEEGAKWFLLIDGGNGFFSQC